MTLSNLDLLQELYRKIIHTGKLLLVNRGFNIYDNKRISLIPASVAEELLGLNSRKKHNE